MASLILKIQERVADRLRRIPELAGLPVVMRRPRQTLDALEADRVLAQAVGPEMIANYVAIKREEVRILGETAPEEHVPYYLHYV